MKYHKLFSLLEERSIPRTRLVEWKIISASTMQRLIHNESVSMSTLETIASFLNCRISDIMSGDRDSAETSY